MKNAKRHYLSDSDFNKTVLVNQKDKWANRLHVQLVGNALTKKPRKYLTSKQVNFMNNAMNDNKKLLINFYRGLRHHIDKSHVTEFMFDPDDQMVATNLYYQALFIFVKDRFFEPSSTRRLFEKIIENVNNPDIGLNFKWEELHHYGVGNMAWCRSMRTATTNRWILRY